MILIFSKPVVNPFLALVSISKTVMVLKQSGKLMRKSSGGERAWFLEEESEPRNKWIFLAGENQRADVSACLTVALSRFWKCFFSIRCKLLFENRNIISLRYQARKKAMRGKKEG